MHLIESQLMVPPRFSPIPVVSVEREDTEFNMIDETIIYTFIETFFNEVNTNKRIRGVPDEKETNLLDMTFNYIYTDPYRRKNMVMAFITTFITPKEKKFNTRNFRKKSDKKNIKKKVKEKEICQLPKAL